MSSLVNYNFWIRHQKKINLRKLATPPFINVNFSDGERIVCMINRAKNINSKAGSQGMWLPWLCLLRYPSLSPRPHVQSGFWMHLMHRVNAEQFWRVKSTHHHIFCKQQVKHRFKHEWVIENFIFSSVLSRNWCVFLIIGGFTVPLRCTECFWILQVIFEAGRYQKLLKLDPNVQFNSTTLRPPSKNSPFLSPVPLIHLCLSLES